ncbi:MAG TPA: type II toxin-antitoxin system Phd/YefM family antitoxin [Rhizomicrobium sp.]|jgi:prevent-host-death family protein
MKLANQVKPLSYFKAHAPEMLEDIAETRNPVIITVNGEAKAVLQDVHSYDEMRETLALLQILAMSERDYAEGKHAPASEVMARIRKKLKA